jgi:hypothetical protein
MVLIPHDDLIKEFADLNKEYRLRLRGIEGVSEDELGMPQGVARAQITRETEAKIGEDRINDFYRSIIGDPQTRGLMATALQRAHTLVFSEEEAQEIGGYVLTVLQDRPQDYGARGQATILAGITREDGSMMLPIAKDDITNYVIPSALQAPEPRPSQLSPLEAALNHYTDMIVTVSMLSIAHDHAYTDQLKELIRGFSEAYETARSDYENAGRLAEFERRDNHQIEHLSHAAEAVAQTGDIETAIVLVEEGIPRMYGELKTGWEVAMRIPEFDGQMGKLTDLVGYGANGPN